MPNWDMARFHARALTKYPRIVAWRLRYHVRELLYALRAPPPPTPDELARIHAEEDRLCAESDHRDEYGSLLTEDGQCMVCHQYPRAHAHS
jgi:hypothetical protein